MSDYKNEAFIDGSNFFSTIKMLGLHVDYARLRDYLFGQGITRINYLTAIHEDDEQHRKLQPLADWMNYNGYRVISKPAKSKTASNGIVTIKGNMDVEIAVAAMQAADYCSSVALFTGDGDFVSLVNALQNKGVIVTVYSSTQTEPSIIADDLRKIADRFVDIVDIRQYIENQRRD